MAMIADEVLLQQYGATQDADAFVRLVARYSNMVYSTCLRVTGNTHDADDAAQECFLALARKAGTIRSSLPGWLHATARHASLAITMKAQRRRDKEVSMPAVSKDAQEPTWKDLEPHIDAAIQDLPPELQSPIILHYFQGMPQSEIAGIMGTDRSTVSRRLGKGVEELRKRLKKAGVILPAAVLVSCLGKCSLQAAPPALKAALGKMAVAGIGKAAGGAPAAAGAASSSPAAATAPGTVQGKIVAALVLGALGVAGVVALMLALGSKARAPGASEDRPVVALKAEDRADSGGIPAEAAAGSAVAEASVPGRERLRLRVDETVPAPNTEAPRAVDEAGVDAGDIPPFPAGPRMGLRRADDPTDRLAAAAAGYPTAGELAARYAETQEKLGSFIVTVEEGERSEGVFKGERVQIEKYQSREIRHDGERIKYIRRIWGDANSYTLDLPKAQASYLSYLWDGKTSYHYNGNKVGDVYDVNNQTPGRGGRLLISLRKDEGTVRWPLNYCPFRVSLDGELLPSLVAARPDARVRDSMEEVNGVPCYVIEGTTDRKHYKVWLDPAHGYHVARRESKWLRADWDWSDSGEVTRFQEIDGVWVPMESRTTVHYWVLDQQMDAVREQKVTELKLGPDHDALESFTTDDIANAAFVKFVGVRDMSYRWQDGELIPIGDAPDSAEATKIAKRIAAREPRTTVEEWLGDFGATEAAAAAAAGYPTAGELAARYAETQEKFGSFIVVVEEVCRSEGVVRGERVQLEKYESSEIRYDGERVKFIRRIWGDTNSYTLDLPKAQALYHSYLWDGKTTYQYSGNKGGDVYDVNNQMPGKGGRLFFERRKSERSARAPLAYGRFRICENYELLPSRVAATPDARVHESMEEVNGAPCYVMEGTTNREGSAHKTHWKLWLDPAHGYHVARRETKELNADVSGSSEVTRFQEIDGVWVPVESRATVHWWVRDQQTDTVREYKTTEFNLDPDHDALGSFTTDDIANGARAYYAAEPDLGYLWQDGELIPIGDAPDSAEVTRIANRIIAGTEARTTVEEWPGKFRATEAAAAAAAGYPTAGELAARYAETQEQFGSFIIAVEEAGRAKGVVRGERVQSEMYQSKEIRYDGERVKFIRRIWGDTNSYTLDLPKAQASYLSYLWDGKTTYHYNGNKVGDVYDVNNQTPGRGGKLLISLRKDEGSARSPLPHGRFRVYSEGELLPSLVAARPDARVRDSMEEVNGVPCYVMEGTTDRKHYKIWLDPAHGYHVARWESKALNADVSGSWEVTRFQEFDGVWVPVESRATLHYWVRDQQSDTVREYKTTEFKRDPDHDALGSFTTDDIANAAFVKFVGVRDMSYRWQDGKLIPIGDAPDSAEAMKIAKRIADREPRTTVEEWPGKFRATEAAAPARVLHFPRDRSLGTLYVEDTSTGEKEYWWRRDAKWEYVGQAHGDVAVPAGKKLWLVLRETGLSSVAALSKLEPNSIQKLYVPREASDAWMPHIAALTGLKELSLTGNITSKGMRFVRSLQHLEWLALHTRKRNVDASLVHVAELKSLKELVLSGAISDAGIAHVAGLKSLRRLVLVGSYGFTDSGLRHLAKLTSLEELKLGGVISDAGLVHVAKLPSLRRLSLNTNRISDDGLANLQNAPALRSLDIRSAERVTDAGLLRLSKLPQLEELNLHGARVTNEGLRHLKSMTSLKKLRLRKTEIDDKGLVHLKGLKSLEHLELPNKGITDEGLARVAELDNLKYLRVGCYYPNPEITDRGLAHIAQLGSLETLEIGGTGITDEGMFHIAASASLRRLGLYGCSFTNEGLAKLTSLTSLSRLSIIGSRNVTISGLNRLKDMESLAFLEAGAAKPDGARLDISGMTGLEYLRLPAVSDEDLACLANLPRLKALGVAYRRSTGDAGMAHLAGVTSLEQLAIGGPNLTDRGLSHLARLKNMMHLTIHGSFTDRGLRHLEGLKGIRKLSITSRNAFSDAALQRLWHSLPNLYGGRFSVGGVPVEGRTPPPEVRAPARARELALSAGAGQHVVVLIGGRVLRGKVTITPTHVIVTGENGITEIARRRVRQVIRAGAEGEGR